MQQRQQQVLSESPNIQYSKFQRPLQNEVRVPNRNQHPSQIPLSPQGQEKGLKRNVNRVVVQRGSE